VLFRSFCNIVARVRLLQPHRTQRKTLHYFLALFRIFYKTWLSPDPNDIEKPDCFS